MSASEHDRYTNVSSINVKDLIFDNTEMVKKAIESRKVKLASASEAEKKQIERDLILIKALN